MSVDVRWPWLKFGNLGECPILETNKPTSEGGVISPFPDQIYGKSPEVERYSSPQSKSEYNNDE